VKVKFVVVQFPTVKTLIVALVCSVLSLPCTGQTKSALEWGEKYNSAGATLIVKETGRVRTNGQTVVTYNLFVSGLPKDPKYIVWTKLPGTNPQTVADAFLNKDGLVVSALADSAHNIAEDPVDLKVVSGRGEVKQFAVVSDDAKYRVFGEVVPFPIETANGPCSLSLTMMGPNYSAVSIVVTGLQPKEKIQIHQQSGNEGGDSKATAAADGTYRATVLPFVKGQSSGKFTFAVTAGACGVGIAIPWGQGSYVIQ
jgi:hypothetical protein